MQTWKRNGYSPGNRRVTVVLQQLNLKLPPEVLADWKQRAAADGLSVRAWLVASLGPATARPAADELVERVAKEALARVEAVLESRRPGPDPAPAAPAPATPATPAAPAATPASPAPAGAITTGELAKELGVSRDAMNARVRRAGGLRVGAVVSGWRCVGTEPGTRGGPPRGLWVPAGTKAVPAAD